MALEAGPGCNCRLGPYLRRHEFENVAVRTRPPEQTRLPNPPEVCKKLQVSLPNMISTHGRGLHVGVPPVPDLNPQTKGVLQEQGHLGKPARAR
jgi:hypothetical protein